LLAGGAKDASYLIRPPDTLVDLTVEKITQGILAGHFEPGERLVETRLSELLGVSRSPLREALSRLEAEGLVESVRGRGTRVVLPTVEDFERMVPVRANLEGQAARLLAGRTQGALEPLIARNAAMKAAARQGRRAYGDAGWRFHRELVELTGNRYLVAAWQPLSVLVRHFMNSYDVYLSDIELGLSVHDRIVELIEAGDPDDAERVVRGVIVFHGFAMIEKPVPPALRGYVAGVTPDARLEARP
jgi:DNA-binding GntR family transcriptional regulator